jgi:hypothetical protein
MTKWESNSTRDWSPECVWVSIEINCSPGQCHSACRRWEDSQRGKVGAAARKPARKWEAGSAGHAGARLVGSFAAVAGAFSAPFRGVVLAAVLYLLGIVVNRA